MPAPLSLQQVRAIEAVGRLHGIAHAAAALNSTQPVVSRQIASAELQLGATLFRRGWGGAEATLAGERVIRRCSAVLKLIARAESDILPNGAGSFLSGLRWHALEAVEAVVRTGCASRAAASLGISQPSVSRALATLDRLTADPLFRRRPRGLEASPQAIRLAGLHHAVQRELALLAEIPKSAHSGLSGALAIGLMPFSEHDMVAQCFGELGRDHPDLQLSAVPGSSGLLLQALLRHELDCVVGVMREAAADRGVEQRFLFDEIPCVIARADHPCHAAPGDLAMLARAQWIVASHGSPMRDCFEDLFEHAGEAPPVRTSGLASVSGVETLIAHGDGLALISYSPRRLERLPTGLRRVDVALPTDRIPIGLHTRAGEPASAGLAAFEASLRRLI